MNYLGTTELLFVTTLTTNAKCFRDRKEEKDYPVWQAQKYENYLLQPNGTGLKITLFILLN